MGHTVKTEEGWQLAMAQVERGRYTACALRDRERERELVVCATHTATEK